MGVLYIAAVGLAAANIACIVIRNFQRTELDSIDGVSCVVKRREYYGNVVAGAGK